MNDTRALLKLTAELHSAARAPQRWPAAWAALCQWLGCPGVFGDGLDQSVVGRALITRIAACSARARRCAEAGAGRCGCGEHACEEKRQTCLALVDHLELALGHVPATPGSKVSGTCLAALESLPVAMMLCTSDRGLLHANSGGSAELARQRWLSLEDGKVRGCGDMESRFSKLFDAVARSLTGDFSLWPTDLVDGRAADIGLRRVDDAGVAPRILISLLPHRVEHTAAQIAHIGERRQLPPRQRELAALLLDGHSLVSAAEQMGITRRTAQDHLIGLFRATGTRRQQDLVAQLARDANGFGSSG